MPDIKGSFALTRSGATSSTAATGTGAFYVGDERSDLRSSDSGLTGQAPSILFSAQRSNSIYGGSNTVQPPAIVLIPQIKF